jgi:hypothetical protein
LVALASAAFGFAFGPSEDDPSDDPTSDDPPASDVELPSFDEDPSAPVEAPDRAPARRSFLAQPEPL